MRKAIFSIIASLVFITFFSTNIYANKDDLKAGDGVPNFVLESPDNKHYELKEMRGKYVFLLFFNRSLKDENQKLARLLKNLYKERTDIEIFMISDMRGIPFFITKNFIKEKMSKENFPVPLLLDWDQKVNKLYNIDLTRINMILIDPTGIIALHQKVGISDFNSLETKLKSIISSGEKLK